MVFFENNPEGVEQKGRAKNVILSNKPSPCRNPGPSPVLPLEAVRGSAPTASNPPPRADLWESQLKCVLNLQILPLGAKEPVGAERLTGRGVFLLLNRSLEVLNLIGQQPAAQFKWDIMPTIASLPRNGEKVTGSANIFPNRIVFNYRFSGFVSYDKK